MLTFSGYILIVDDDPDAREILSRIVESMGLRFKQACDGQEALDLIREEQPTLIFLDLMMPRVNGFIVLSYLQSNPALRTIKVIVLSAVGQDEMFKIPQVVCSIQKARFSPRQIQELVRTTLQIADSPAAATSSNYEADLVASA